MHGRMIFVVEIGKRREFVTAIKKLCYVLSIGEIC